MSNRHLTLLVLTRTLALVTFILGLQSAVSAQGSSSCDDGWILHNDQCYLLRDEYETFNHAGHTCDLFGSELAYATNEDELSYMKTLVGRRNTYGWWYGAQVAYGGFPLIFNKELTIYTTIQDGSSVVLPKDRVLSAPSTDCIGLLRDASKYDVKYIMIDVPCTVVLPYACRGDPNNSKIPKDDPNIVHNDTRDVFWFSSIHDRRSYDDALQACMEKSMTLLSIRGDRQMRFIMDQLEKRQEAHVDPWWIGLRVDKGVFSWSNRSVEMEPSMVVWNRDREYKYYRPFCRILLTDGTQDDRNCYQRKAPFICKRPHRISGNFGCPPKWSRAGQSCYKYVTTHPQVFAKDAEKICSKMESHIVSVDTPSEKTWLLKSTLGGGLRGNLWTSLSDKKKVGSFVWADGSSFDPKVVTFGKGNSLDRDGKCFTLYPKTKRIQRFSCEFRFPPGCQYPAKGPSDCLTKNWKYFKGYCYFLMKASDWRIKARAFPKTLHVCYADIAPKNNEIVISHLRVDREDILDFLATQLATELDSMWLGMHELSKGVYAWDDGTRVNMSLFDESNYFGTDSTTSKCAVMHSNGEFIPLSCSTCNCGDLVCEKEVPYGISGNNSATCNLTPVFLMLGTIFIFIRFL